MPDHRRRKDFHTDWHAPPASELSRGCLGYRSDLLAQTCSVLSVDVSERRCRGTPALNDALLALLRQDELDGKTFTRQSRSSASIFNHLSPRPFGSIDRRLPWTHLEVV